MKILAACGLLLAVSSLGHAQDNFANSVVSYVTGTGSGFYTFYNVTSSATGAPSTAATVVAPAYNPSDIFGVGEGGELTVEFNTPITNNPTGHADGMDFTIFGNDFFALSGTTISSIYDHTGLTVWVSQDDVNFYQLVAPDGLPHGADDLFPTEGTGDPTLPLNPSLTLSNFIGLTATQALSLYNGSAGGSSYSISWAQNSSGDPVNLSSVSYIKVEGSTGYGYIDAFSRVQSIPEPSNVALLLFGAAGLLVCSRRFRAKLRWLKKLPAFLFLAASFLFTSRASAQSFTLSNIQYWVGSGINESAFVISWNDGISPDALAFGYRWNAGTSGSTVTVYNMMMAIQAADSLLQFTANPLFTSPSDYAVYSAFYNLTGGGGPTVGVPENLGGSENGSAPAGDHYREGWFTGFWGVLNGVGDPYVTGGSWSSSSYGVSSDALSNNSWYGLSFSTDVTNFNIPDPGPASAVFPVPAPEPSSCFLLSLGAVAFLGSSNWLRRHFPTRLPG